MKFNAALIVSVALVSVSYIPQGVAIYHLLNNGGLDWPMIWGNETIAWSAIFSVLALIGLFLAIKNVRSTPKGSVLVILFASIVIISSLFALVSSGVGPASNGDDEKLKLLEFWWSEWWK